MPREKQLCLDHNIVVWQHPFFWYSAPAMLKKWPDLVLEYGFAYGHEGTALHGKNVCPLLRQVVRSKPTVAREMMMIPWVNCSHPWGKRHGDGVWNIWNIYRLLRFMVLAKLAIATTLMAISITINVFSKLYTGGKFTGKTRQP
ncbi:NAD(P)H-dependent oxidoreductase [[Limnothrix rosea] IAM M-220]|uniref:NAD(P)H-dependent oxidoreductase n=1 Tax=[Limnothrix rosea] IAM M-220 TaxID=454133 RepID=UPI001CEC95AE|nr:NAD(P)H-dependent oxidoreductase [[Limnothrix rosea] IAM M-220]